MKIIIPLFYIFLLINLSFSNYSFNAYNRININKKRFLSQKNNKFLPAKEDIEDIKNYLSTKYQFYSKGYTGQNIKIGIFDSGINNKILKCNLKKVINFSDEDETDKEGHGTYISSVICSKKYGISYNSEIYVYKIFNSEGITKNKWIKNAIEYALNNDNLDIMNFSFGGITYNDYELQELIKKVTEKGIIIISSSGNEGPSYGTISFPGNLKEVITVGGVSKKIFSIYEHSSRGPAILGKNKLISKPNTWCLAENVKGLSNMGKTVIKNGSSISTAIVTGFIGLLLSGLKQNEYYYNTAILMSLIYDSNIKIIGINKYEHISGLFNPNGLLYLIENNYIKNYNNKLRVLNYKCCNFNLGDTSNEIFNEQLEINKNLKKYFNYELNIYSSMQPLNINFILLNLYEPENYNKINLPLKYNITYEDNKAKENCFEIKHLNQITKIQQIMEIILEINSEKNECNYYKENIKLLIKYRDTTNENKFYIKLNFNYIPKPNKYSRILFDRYHNNIYPFDNIVLKDNLFDSSYDYDWSYENQNTNYFSLFEIIKDEGFYIEDLNDDINNVNFNNYGIFAIFDIEKNYSEKEIKKLQKNYEQNELSILIVSDWNNYNISKHILQFNYQHNYNILYNNSDFGSNIHNLNKFLSKYNILLGNESLTGKLYTKNQNKIIIKSGTAISLFPKGGYLYGGQIDNDEIFINKYAIKTKDAAIIGLYENTNNNKYGKIGILTDSYCLDDSQLGINKKEDNCFWLIKDIINFLIHGYHIQNSNILNQDIMLQQTYFNPEINNQKNISLLFLNNEYTNKIPNELFRGYNYNKNNSHTIITIKAFLLLFIPIFIILIIMYFKNLYRQQENKIRRLETIKRLEEMRIFYIYQNEELKRLTQT